MMSPLSLLVAISFVTAATKKAKTTVAAVFAVDDDIGDKHCEACVFNTTP